METQLSWMVLQHPLYRKDHMPSLLKAPSVLVQVYASALLSSLLPSFQFTISTR